MTAINEKLDPDWVKEMQWRIDTGQITFFNDRKDTPLIEAIQNNYCEKVEFLIRAGASIYLPIGQSPLYWAANFKRIVSKNIVRLIADKVKKDYSYIKEDIFEILITANWSLQTIIQIEDVGMTKIALDRRFKSCINEKDSHGRIALHMAVENVDIDNVKLLLECNADVNAIDERKRTSLFYLFTDVNENPNNTQEKLQILKILLDRKSSSQNRIFDNQDHIINFLQYANAEAIKMMMEYGMDIFSVDTHFYFCRVLHILASNKNTGVIEMLYDNIFKIEERNQEGETPLMIAAKFGAASNVEFLLNKGSNIEATDNYMCTALYYAVNYYSESEGQYKECVKILLERDANTPIYWKNLFTCFRKILNSKSKKNYSPVIRIILEHLALQEFNGIIISQPIQIKINAQNQLKDYFETSKKQLSSKIYESLTLSDFLKANDKKFERYARNREARLKIQNCIRELSNFYYFSTILEKHLSKAIEIVTLKEEAAYIIGKIIKIDYESFPHVADNIVSYLDKQSMQSILGVSVEEINHSFCNFYIQ